MVNGSPFEHHYFKTFMHKSPLVSKKRNSNVLSQCFEQGILNFKVSFLDLSTYEGSPSQAVLFSENETTNQIYKRKLTKLEKSCAILSQCY